MRGKRSSPSKKATGSTRRRVRKETKEDGTERPHKRLRFSDDVHAQNRNCSVDETKSTKVEPMLEIVPGCTLFFGNVPKGTSKASFTNFIQTKVLEISDESVQVVNIGFWPTKKVSNKVNARVIFACQEQANVTEKALDKIDFSGCGLNVRQSLPKKNSKKASSTNSGAPKENKSGPIKVIQQDCAVQISHIPVQRPPGFRGLWRNVSDIEAAVRCHFEEKMSKDLYLDQDDIQIPYCHSSLTSKGDSYQMILEFGSRDIAAAVVRLGSDPFFGHSLSFCWWRGKYEKTQHPECAIWLDGIPPLSDWPKGVTCRSMRKDLRETIQKLLQRKFGIDAAIRKDNILTEHKPMRASIEFMDRDVAEKALQFKNILFRGSILPISPFCDVDKPQESQQEKPSYIERESSPEHSNCATIQSTGDRTEISISENPRDGIIGADEQSVAASEQSICEHTEKQSFQNSVAASDAEAFRPTVHSIRCRLAAITGSWSHDMSPSDSTLTNVLEQVKLLESVVAAEKKRSSYTAKDHQQELASAISTEIKRLTLQFNTKLAEMKSTMEHEKHILKARCLAADDEKEAAIREVTLFQEKLQKYEKSSEKGAIAKVSDAKIKALEEEIQLLKEGKEKLQQQLNDTFQTLTKATTTVIETQSKINDLQNLHEQESKKVADLETRLQEEMTKRKDVEDKLQQSQSQASHHVPRISITGNSVPSTVASIKEENH